VLFIWSTGRVLGPDEMVITPSWMPGWLSYIIWSAGFLGVIPWVLTLGLILILSVAMRKSPCVARSRSPLVAS
jgi:hypothetical protein